MSDPAGLARLQQAPHRCGHPRRRRRPEAQLRRQAHRVRRRSSHGRRTVVDGPFAETKELIAGWWIWNVKSMDEAVEWEKQCPSPMPGETGCLELRPHYEAADFEVAGVTVPT